MATALEYILKLSKGDFHSGMKDAEAATKRLDDGFGKLKDTLLGIAGITIGAEFLKSASESFLDMEKTAAQLKFTVGSRGGLASDLKDLTEQSETLGKSSFFNHVEIEKAQKSLLNYGVSIKETKKSMGTLTDVGLVMGEGVGEVGAKVAGAARTGIFRTLKEYGISLSDLKEKFKGTTDESKRFDIIMQSLKDHFVGAAEEMKNSEFFKMKKLQDQFEEFKELVGRDLLKAFNMLRPYLISFLDHLTKFVHWIEVNKNGMLKLAEVFGTVAIAIGIVDGAMALLAVNPVILGLTAIAAALSILIIKSNQLYDAQEKLIDQRVKLVQSNETFLINQQTEALSKKLGVTKEYAEKLVLLDELTANQEEERRAREALKGAQEDLANAKQSDYLSRTTSLIPGVDLRSDAVLKAQKAVDDNAERITNAVASLSVIKQRMAPKIAGPGTRGEKDEPTAPSKTETHHENIVINITKMVEKLELNTVTLKEGTQEIKKIIADVMQEAVNSVQYLHN